MLYGLLERACLLLVLNFLLSVLWMVEDDVRVLSLLLVAAVVVDPTLPTSLLPTRPALA